MKKVFAILLVLAMAVSLVACAAPKEQNGGATETQGTQALKKFTVTVVHADGTSKEFSYETDETYVGPVLMEAGLVKGNDGPYGLEIIEVDGEKAVYAENGAYWAIYVGKEYAMKGIDQTPVTDGETYKLEYTRG